MGAKRLVLAALAGGVSMWVLAGIWHELVMAQFYSAQTHATHEGTGIILAAYFILGALMAYLYPKFSNGSNSLIYGARFGAIIGILWVFPHELAMAGAHGESLAYVFKNGLWHVVEQGLGGVVIAAVFLKFR